MMDPGPAGGARRGKRRGRRSNGGSGERGGARPNSGGGNSKRRRKRRDNRGQRPRSAHDAMPPTTGDESSILGGRLVQERDRGGRSEGPPDAFALFAAYYCGVTPDDGYRKPNIEEIARRYGMTADGIRELLVELDLEPGVVKSTCDLENGLLDIRLAPAGISRTEIARDLYQELLAARAAAGDS